MAQELFANFDFSHIANCWRLSANPVQLIGGEPRRLHAFTFFADGDSRYDFHGGTVETHRGSFLYLPQGAAYTIRRYTPIECYVIDFELYQTEPVPPYHRALREKAAELENLFRLACAYQREGKCRDAEIKSVLYQIVAQLQRLETSSYAPAAAAAKIRPALDYLREHMCCDDVSNVLLANLCDLSERRFTELFASCMHYSPKQYLIRLRLQKACALLKAGDLTVTDIAYNCGFRSVPYFSRIFKEKTGSSPTEYAETANRPKSS